MVISSICPWKFCRIEASRAVFWSLLCYKELELTIKPFTNRILHGLLIQMQNITLQSLGIHRKQNLEIAFGFKSDLAVLTFTFHFLSSPLFFAFLASFFVFFWAFSRLHFGGNSGVGFFTCHENQISENTVRWALRFFALIRED